MAPIGGPIISRTWMATPLGDFVVKLSLLKPDSRYIVPFSVLWCTLIGVDCPQVPTTHPLYKDKSAPGKQPPIPLPTNPLPPFFFFSALLKPQKNSNNNKMAIIKSGKVVIVLAGRFAGRKAVVVKTFDEGSGDKHFGHCLIAGIDRNPRKVTNKMSKAKVEKRSKMKPFVKYVNYNHIMPTRYVVDMELKKTVDESEYKTERKTVRKSVKKVFEEKYLNQKPTEGNKKATGTNYFFQKLRF